MGSVLKKILRSLTYRWFILLIPYYRFKQNRRIKEVRKKNKIKVLFVVAELSAWKTELLFKAMAAHPRFEPIVGATTSREVPGSKSALIEYLVAKKYTYVDLDQSGTTIKDIKPDIIFYYKPYETSYLEEVFIFHNTSPIICQVNYAFNQGGVSDAYKQVIRKYAWKEFIENDLVFDTIVSLNGVYSNNKVVTGTPMQDVLMLPKEAFSDPWKDKSGKKRIIYAPHHSLKGTNGSYIEYSTFLENGEFILQLAKKYSDLITWAFKPHPTLYPKLVKYWGKEKTDAYYVEWRNIEIGQIELGEYVGLFKYSDAMIHDSCSFIAEYLYTHKPVMFLEMKSKTASEMLLGMFGYESYNVHYHGQTHEEIEKFVNNVINGVDPLYDNRIELYKKHLVPPFGETACNNIIDVILGNKSALIK